MNELINIDLLNSLGSKPFLMLISLISGFLVSYLSKRPNIKVVGGFSCSVGLKNDVSAAGIEFSNDASFMFGWLRIYRDTPTISRAWLYDLKAEADLTTSLRWVSPDSNALLLETKLEVGYKKQLLVFFRFSDEKEFFVSSPQKKTDVIPSIERIKFNEEVKNFLIFLEDTLGRRYYFRIYGRLDALSVSTYPVLPWCWDVRRFFRKKVFIYFGAVSMAKFHVLKRAGRFFRIIFCRS